jgi:putative acetyltransferase
MSKSHPLRPFLPADVARLQDLLAQSIEELTQDDYDEEQRVAWMSQAADAQAFAQRLAKNVTLVVEQDGEILGFASLKDNKDVDLLFVHPYAAGDGVGATLLDALERLAKARGTEVMTADVSDTAYDFFEARGYAAVQRNNIPIGDVWLANTTMSKALKAKPTGAS